MAGNDVLQVCIYLLVLMTCVKPLGLYMAQVYEGNVSGVMGYVERFFYRVSGVRPADEMSWKRYLAAMLCFNLMGFLLLYALQRLQFQLPFNPQAFHAVTPMLAFNTTAGFISNTDWQAYAGESSLSYLTQMLGMTVQNFLSAATGMALVVALIRGIVRQESLHLGNFWVDMVRGVLYILLPLAFVFAILLSSQGVIQNFKSYEKVQVLQPSSYQESVANNAGNIVTVTKQLTTQVIPMGPAASQIAIKQLGTNGGGFFNANSAHPFENPNPLTNFLEMLAILLIPAALCYTFGVMARDKKQGWALFFAMLIIFVPCMLGEILVEKRGNPMLLEQARHGVSNLINVMGNYVETEEPRVSIFTATPEVANLGIQQSLRSKFPYSSGSRIPYVVNIAGNMEGKETRFGIINSAMWATAATASSNGSSNAMLGSFTPLGSLIPLCLMHLGEIVFGGVGSGLYGMLMFVIIAVFVAGLMVGRTPEYLGKKIGAFEIKMAVFAILVMPITVLLLTAVAVMTPAGVSAVGNFGAHGFAEILYAFISLGHNNGSVLAGLNTDTPFYNIAGGLEMLAMRFWVAISVLALAGSLVRKKTLPASSGTLLTHKPLFILFLIAVILALAALTILPALSLGPFVEHLLMWGYNGD